MVNTSPLHKGDCMNIKQLVMKQTQVSDEKRLELCCLRAIGDTIVPSIPDTGKPNIGKSILNGANLASLRTAVHYCCKEELLVIGETIINSCAKQGKKKFQSIEDKLAEYTLVPGKILDFDFPTINGIKYLYNADKALSNYILKGGFDMSHPDSIIRLGEIGNDASRLSELIMDVVKVREDLRPQMFSWGLRVASLLDEGRVKVISLLWDTEDENNPVISMNLQEDDEKVVVPSPLGHLRALILENINSNEKNPLLKMADVSHSLSIENENIAEGLEEIALINKKAKDAGILVSLACDADDKIARGSLESLVKKAFLAEMVYCLESNGYNTPVLKAQALKKACTFSKEGELGIFVSVSKMFDNILAGELTADFYDISVEVLTDKNKKGEPENMPEDGIYWCRDGILVSEGLLISDRFTGLVRIEGGEAFKREFIDIPQGEQVFVDVIPCREEDIDISYDADEQVIEDIQNLYKEESELYPEVGDELIVNGVVREITAVNKIKNVGVIYHYE